VLLESLGAVDADGGLTERGKKMRALALPPRLAAMVVSGQQDGHGYAAAELAVLLTEQGLGGQDADLEVRLSRFRADRSPRGTAARALAARLAGGKPSSTTPCPAAALLVHAFPDRIARQRGARGKFVLANGRGAMIDETDRLAGSDFLVIADMSGKAQAARILAAAELSGEALADVLDTRAVESEECVFDAPSGSVRARRISRLGAITLAETPLPKPDDAAAMAVLCQAIRKLGLKALPFSSAGLQLRDPDRVSAQKPRRAVAGCFGRGAARGARDLVRALSARHPLVQVDRPGRSERGAAFPVRTRRPQGTRPAGADPLPGADRFAAAHPL
jgi:ATP-dependent helicase HrpB